MGRDEPQSAAQLIASLSTGLPWQRRSVSWSSQALSVWLQSRTISSVSSSSESLSVSAVLSSSSSGISSKNPPQAFVNNTNAKLVTTRRSDRNRCASWWVRCKPHEKGGTAEAWRWDTAANDSSFEAKAELYFAADSPEYGKAFDGRFEGGTVGVAVLIECVGVASAFPVQPVRRETANGTPIW